MVEITVITGIMARSAKLRHLSYLEGDFEVFRQQGRHVAPMGVKFGLEDFHAKSHPIGATIMA